LKLIYLKKLIQRLDKGILRDYIRKKLERLDMKDKYEDNRKNAVEHFINVRQETMFSFDKIVNTRYIRSSIKQSIAKTKAVDRFIHQLTTELNSMHKLKVDGKYIIGAVNQFCKNRREINKLIREKANEKIKELSEQGDVKWLNQ
jgi:hypothetical protein